MIPAEIDIDGLTKDPYDRLELRVEKWKRGSALQGWKTRGPSI
jgi:hypothetical protein